MIVMPAMFWKLWHIRNWTSARVPRLSRKSGAPGVVLYSGGPQGSVGSRIPGDPAEEFPEGVWGGSRCPKP